MKWKQIAIDSRLHTIYALNARGEIWWWSSAFRRWEKIPDPPEEKNNNGWPGLDHGLAGIGG